MKENSHCSKIAFVFLFFYLMIYMSTYGCFEEAEGNRTLKGKVDI